ncbi:PREDICTED: serine carboxypeptidase-like 9 [Camelina sativa]|uniref:Serine carboxypeptidase-like 9 n=1 Tax=Camelina sativa TaxID=90675 RepID=A0ABM0SWA6_CAMSA|nr:PREDICTED: serine carboxypeptidase-like 9 [Camelina sativa]
MNMTLKFLLLLLFVLCHHAESGSIVKFLPGFEGPLPFELETGYIGIGEKEEDQLFYYFIKSENNPEEDPLLLWLEGAPGSSSLSGLLMEIGPLTVKTERYNGSVPSLVSTTYSWTKAASIIFLDQPVGSGFSYSSKTPLDNSTDTIEVNKIHEFLQKWLSKHPQYLSNPFYATGNAYAGMLIPALVEKISKENYICCKPPINLQGYVLGNPVTDYATERNYRVQFAHGMSLISDELYESLKRECNGNYFNVDPPRSKKCLKLVEEFNKLTDDINFYDILLPKCDEQLDPENMEPDCFYYKYYLEERWANTESVREALHIKKGTTEDWLRLNHVIPYENDIRSSVPYHKKNSIIGYRSLIFSGDHDMVSPTIATQAWIKSLNYSITRDWQPWRINDEIAGYTRTYSNKMTFATVKGCGHTSEYLPEETSILFKRWLNGQLV